MEQRRISRIEISEVWLFATVPKSLLFTLHENSV
jgi:hypothetical protein